MKIIAHRGNIRGKTIFENDPSYIREALKEGYDVEIDIRLCDNLLKLGHDTPQCPCPEEFFTDPNVWFHAKDINTLGAILKSTHCFIHDRDEATLTSKGYIWVYPGKLLVRGCVSVLPEQGDYSNTELTLCAALCTDYAEKYRDIFNKE